MCGIIAYCGEELAQPILLSGLEKLEYRGYDSVGIACFPSPAQGHASDRGSQATAQDTGFVMHKEVGKVADLVRLCREHQHDPNQQGGHSGIGHCRWATHGAVTRANAHPHYSADGQVILVHNGIVENHRELRQFLENRGLAFCSQSDSETVANLLSYLLQIGEDHSGRSQPQTAASLKEFDGRSQLGFEALPHNGLYGKAGDDLVLRALQSLRHWLQGSYALAIMFAARPDEVYAIRCESPLLIGLGKNGNYFASDALPLLEYTQDVIYLQNHEISRLYCHNQDQPADIELYNADGEILRYESRIQQLQISVENTDKQGYRHFMAKEIHEQPRVFCDLFQRHVDTENWQPSFGEIDVVGVQKLLDCEQLIFVSCGTSYHASLYAKYILEKYCHLPVSVEYASEFRYRQPVLGPHSIVVGLSQSGETADTLAALNMAKGLGACTLGLVNIAGSSIARSVDILLCSHCGPEVGVASTKVYTAQLLVLYYLALYMGQLRGQFKDSPELVAEKLQESQKLPTLSQTILSRSEQLCELGRAYAGYQHMLYLGRGLYYPLALEGALKLKELSYIHAEGYAAAEMKHGPIALIDTRMPVVVLAPQYGLLYQKMQSNIAEVQARGGRILGFVGAVPGCSERELGLGMDVDSPYSDTFILPQLSEELDVLLYAVALQLFAYYIALAKGIDPDQPRNLAKSVTVE